MTNYCKHMTTSITMVKGTITLQILNLWLLPSVFFAPANNMVYNIARFQF
jgi:hypothetical protein